MLEFYDGELIECPCCGRFTCEVTRVDLLCPHCLYHEILPKRDSSGGGVHLTAKDGASSEDSEFLMETLGEYIEGIPANYENWDLHLDSERNLKMNKAYQNENSEQSVKVFDVMVKEDAKNGATYWQKVGVAFPLTTGTNGLSLKLNMFPNLRLYVMESVRPVGAAKIEAENRQQDTPF